MLLMLCCCIDTLQVKRNADDIGEAFAGYQQALRWLAGKEDLYDAAIWKTKGYPTGHFKFRYATTLLKQHQQQHHHRHHHHHNNFHIIMGSTNSVSQLLSPKRLTYDCTSFISSIPFDTATATAAAVTGHLCGSTMAWAR